MKSALLIFAALVSATSAQIIGGCTAPNYTETLEPTCINGQKIKLPNYEDVTTYYSCINQTAVLTSCPAATPYFTYVLQDCYSCAEYIPADECSGLKITVNCTAIETTTSTTTTTTTAKPTTVTTTTAAGNTTATTTSTTTTTTTVAAPTAPTPGGSTVSVPPPPSPNPPGVIEPSTPLPTAPTSAGGPPSV